MALYIVATWFYHQVTKFFDELVKSDIKAAAVILLIKLQMQEVKSAHGIIDKKCNSFLLYNFFHIVYKFYVIFRYGTRQQFFYYKYEIFSSSVKS